jgi:Uma2 family endonuclease
MNVAHQKPMTAEEFVAWAVRQERGRYELVDGMVVQMNAEQAIHGRVKLDLVIALRTAFKQADLEGDVFGDGMAVRINETTVHEPDALVRCGTPVANETTILTDPVIVCEVLSPSTGPIDTGVKLLNYFSIPSVTHYLVVNTSKRVVLQRRQWGRRLRRRWAVQESHCQIGAEPRARRREHDVHPVVGVADHGEGGEHVPEARPVRCGDAPARDHRGREHDVDSVGGRGGEHDAERQPDVNLCQLLHCGMLTAAA